MSVRGVELAEEEVKKYIDSNLAKFYRIRFSQMIHLPCFTDTDRQRIKATCTNEGNNETTFLFFQSLCCREGWVPCFVAALREQHMGTLADKLEGIYRSKLLPPLRTPPAASAPPAVNRPSAPPLQPEINERNPCGQTFSQALPSSPSRLAASSANPTPQDTGDYQIPVQENSHLSEKSKLAVHSETTNKGAEPGFPSTSDVSSASNIGAAVGGDQAVESPVPYPVRDSAWVPGPVEERPLPSQMISTSANSVVEKWDGRQHHPVTVKNGRFGNAHRPEDSGTGSTLPAAASSNEPEEDYYSSDSVLLPLGGPRADSAAERKVHVLRGDRTQENPPVADSLQSRTDTLRKNLPASHGSAEDRTQLFLDPSSRSSPANDAQPYFIQTGTKPVPDVMPEHPIRLPPSDLDASSSVATKALKPRREFSAAGGDRPSDEFKLLVEGKRSSGETTGTGAFAGRPPWEMETLPSAVGDRKKDTRIFHSSCDENDVPSKPGVLSSDHDEAGDISHMYSGSSERLRMSNGDSTSVSTSDPILISESSSISHSTTSGNPASAGAVDATLPPEVDTGEEDTSFRSHHLIVEENPSMELMGVPFNGASLRPSPRALPDPTSGGQAENKAKKDHQADPSLPDKAKGEPTSDNVRLLLAGIALAFLASVAFVLYKKK